MIFLGVKHTLAIETWDPAVPQWSQPNLDKRPLLPMMIALTKAGRELVI